MLGEPEGKAEAEGTQARASSLSKEPAGKGIKSPSFSTCLIPGREGLHGEEQQQASERDLVGGECSAEGCAMAPAVARFPPNPFSMPPLLGCPCSKTSLAPLGTAISLVDEGGTLGSRKLPTSQKVWPIIFFEGQRQQPVRSDRLYHGCCDCSQPGVGVPRRGVWALWLMDVVDSSQDDSSLKG